MNAFNLYEAYAAVYDEDLKEDLLAVEEDFSFIDDLSDNELDQIMEEILSEGEVSLTESVEIFEELIMELNPYAPAGSKAAKEYAKSTTKTKKSAEASERRAARVERIKGATKRAGEAIKSRVSDVKKGAEKVKSKVTGKLSSAKEKVKGFLGKIGRAAKAGASAAKKELSGDASREAKARTTGREMRRAAKRQASASRGRDTSEFEKSSSDQKRPPKVTVGKTEKAGGETKEPKKTVSEPNQARIAKAKAKLSRAATGTKGGVRFATSSGQVSSTSMKSGSLDTEARAKKAKQFAQKAGLSDHYNYVLDAIFEDMINEGYVSDYDTAFYVVESLSDSDLDYVLESYDLYLTEEVETLDLYDVVLDHLLDEGYADTEEAATVIMANMSEEWRNKILENI